MINELQLIEFWIVEVPVNPKCTIKKENNS